MRLDLMSIFIADVAVTSVLGAMLLLSGIRNRANRSLRWWGLAHLVLGGGVALLPPPGQEEFSLTLGVGLILLAYALMWHAARVFDRRPALPLAVIGGGAIWIVLRVSGVAPTAWVEFATYSLLNSVYCFAIAFEFWRGRDERLLSRWPAVLLQSITGLGFLAWIPLSLIPAGERGGVFISNDLFPWVILATLLGRVAMAFVVLAMAKERLEQMQRTAALTDPLTGLPNRRAFFRQAARRLRGRDGAQQLGAVLLFDLDHFKDINDRFGHGVGDTVLRLFAESMTQNVAAGDVVGRIGGEEFAALLPGADAEHATRVAERIRSSFARAATSIDENLVQATVSAGGVAMDYSRFGLDVLLGRADVALYAAKNAGRNCVKILGPNWHAHAPSGIHTAASPSLVPTPARTEYPVALTSRAAS